ncbi:GGDEF domain-containing protein [Proteobacteria bacterium 005FR1]|nr:GGDEF domain-containing protein [Proteobacteria bacterium 005FR1]
MIELLTNPFTWTVLAVGFGAVGWGMAFYYRHRRVCQSPEQSMTVVARMFPDSVLIVDAGGRIIASSQPATDLFGYSDEEFRQLNVEALMPGEFAERHQRQRSEFLRGSPGKAMDNEIRCLSKSGEEIPAITRVRTFRLGRDIYGLVAVMDLRTFKSREQNLKALAERDPLTGVANRRLFDRDFHREWGRAMREQSSIAIVMVDVDSFKEYNDYHGHPGGDAALKTVAGILSGILQRSTDTLARYGGEEFIFLLPGISEEDAEMKARELCEAVESSNIPHGRSRVSRWVTVSVGVAAMVPCQGDQMQDLISRADAALYEAKSSGRNRVQTHSGVTSAESLPLEG